MNECPDKHEPDHDAKNGSGDGRDFATGRFTCGNSYGKGNPLAKRQARYRQAMSDAVDPERLGCITLKLAELAEAGDVAAARLVLEYLVGRPMPLVEVFDSERHPIRILGPDDPVPVESNTTDNGGDHGE